MSELHLRNSVVVLIVFTILVMIFFATVIMPSFSEKMICGLQGGQWDTMLRGCGFEPQTCMDAGGYPKEISGKCEATTLCTGSSVSLLGCKFK